MQLQRQRLSFAHGGRMGICGTWRKKEQRLHLQRKRQSGKCGVVLRQQRKYYPRCQNKIPERAGTLRHERKCMGMVLGLVRLILVIIADQSLRCVVGVVPRHTRWELEQQRFLLSCCLPWLLRPVELVRQHWFPCGAFQF